jgi:putative FmdB family regulatory protein
MTYDFYCQACKKGYEVTTPVSKRDEPHRCPKGHVMRRQLSVGLGVQWSGKFQGRWDKVKEGVW